MKQIKICSAVTIWIWFPVSCFRQEVTNLHGTEIKQFIIIYSLFSVLINKSAPMNSWSFKWRRKKGKKSFWCFLELCCDWLLAVYFRPLGQKPIKISWTQLGGKSLHHWHCFVTASMLGTRTVLRLHRSEMFGQIKSIKWMRGQPLNNTCIINDCATFWKSLFILQILF